MIKKQKLEKDYFDSIIWLFFITCVLIGLVTYVKPNDDFTINKFGIYNVDNQGRGFSIAYNFTSSVFGVNQDITVSIIARPSVAYSNIFSEEASSLDHFYLYFQAVTTDQDVYVDGVRHSPPIKLEKGADNWYRGQYLIKYDEEGDKCVKISLERLYGVPRYCESNEQPVLIIQPYESTLQYKVNKIFVTLTWVLLGFSVLSARDPLRSILKISGEKIESIKKRKGDQDENSEKNNIS